jgi:hypothetical protein
MDLIAPGLVDGSRGGLLGSGTSVNDGDGGGKSSPWVDDETARCEPCGVAAREVEI